MEWTWDDDTALVAASREGHHLVVLELLSRGADPNAKSCPEDDVHETAEDAVNRKMRSGKRPRTELEKNQRFEAILRMLEYAKIGTISTVLQSVKTKTVPSVNSFTSRVFCHPLRD